MPPMPPPVAGPATPVPPPTPEQMRERRVAVDVDSSRPDTVIERRISVTESHGAWLVVPTRSNDELWEQVCVTPCRVDVDRFSTYRVRAQNGVSASSPFTVPQGQDRLALRVDAGSAHAHHLGQGLAVAGLAAMIVGASLLVAAAHTEDHDREKTTRVAGFITGGAGIVAFGVGAPLAVFTRSRVFSGDRDLSCR